MKYHTIIALSIGLAAGCMVTNSSHCSYPGNPGRTKCGKGYLCSACEVDNDGCVPDEGDGVPKGCEQRPLDSSSGEEPTNTSTQTTGMTTETGADTSTGSDSGTGSTSRVGSTSESTSESSDSDTDVDSSTGEPPDPICGDGIVNQPSEECDDGNQDNSDDCLDTCLDASCGDGFLQEGEECEDSVDPNSCMDCKLRVRRVFVTSTEFKGNLGGVGGADQKCQDLAMAAGFENYQAFKAWISDGNVSVASRFDTQYKGFYGLFDGTILAVGWDDLVDGSLADPIHLDEFGMEVSATVWTNTKTSGSSFGADNHCSVWASSSVMFSGKVGTTTSSGIDWTNQANVQACSATARLYCFEDLMP